MEKIEDMLARMNKAFTKANPHELRDIFSTSTSTFAIYQTKVWFSISLISYTLSKMLQKPRLEQALDKNSDRISEALGQAAAFYKMGKGAECQQALDKVLEQIQGVETQDRRFISDLVTKSRTKIAALLYAQGLSLDTAVGLTGAERNEVLNYSGKTMMPDRMGKTLSERDRLAYARKLVKKGNNNKK